MLRWRIISAIALIAVLAGACWLDLRHPLGGYGGLWLMPLGVAATWLASVEVTRLVFRSPWWGHTLAIALANVSLFLSASAPLFAARFAADSPIGRLGWPMLVFTLATGLSFAEQMRTYRGGERAISRLGRSVFAFAYVGVLMSFLLLLRIYGSPATGFVALLSVIVIVKMSDTGAYTFGRLFGGRLFGKARFAPVLSPKKTIEGALGALISGVIGSYLSLVVLGHWIGGADFAPPQWWAIVVYGIVLTGVGMFGDLAESLLKRDAGQKDSSHTLPGFGGVLDLLDSILFAAPAAYALWATGMLDG